jgi:hypothetical protein
MKTASIILVMALFGLSACEMEPAEEMVDESAEELRGPKGGGGGGTCQVHFQCVFGKHFDRTSCSCVDDAPPPPAEEEEEPAPTEEGCPARDPCEFDEIYDEATCACVHDTRWDLPPQ